MPKSKRNHEGSERRIGGGGIEWKRAVLGVGLFVSIAACAVAEKSGAGQTLANSPAAVVDTSPAAPSKGAGPAILDVKPLLENDDQSQGLASGGGAPPMSSAGVISQVVSDGHTQPASGVDCADAGLLTTFRDAVTKGSGSLKLLYPYDGTVWPRGLLPPVIQWAGDEANEVYIRITSADYSFEGCYAGAGTGARFTVPEAPWTGAGEWSQGGGDPATVSIAVRSGGSVRVAQQQWTFALAALKGAVYYNTYTSPKALAQVPPASGAVLKIVPGEPEPTLFLTVDGPACVGCHSLSADGSTMALSNHSYPFGPFEGQSYDVSSNTPTSLAALPEMGFAGVYPDGSRVLTNGPPNPSDNPSFPSGPNNVAALAQAESELFDARVGTKLGPGPAVHAQMPTFSPDGKLVVYNSFDHGGGHAIHVSDFDAATNTFSNQREIYRDSARYPGWPFVTPDGKAVVYVLGTRDDFVSQVPNLEPTGRSHLRITYLDHLGESIPLDAANGFKNGSVYLPAGADRDTDLEFFPTVSPLAAGGYFWVFFTSRRTYGNISMGLLDLPDSKKIWATAIDIGAAPGADPSHPAFLLPGQEMETGNARAFTTLSACQSDGSACESGTDCCSGFCTDGVCGPPRQCANVDERCVAKEDCCNPDPRIQCIAGFCAETSRTRPTVR